MAYELALGTVREPGAGLIPFGVAALLGLMSVRLCFKALFKAMQEDAEKQTLKGIDWGRIVLVLLTLIGYGIAFTALGFHICTFLLMVVLLGVMGRLKWWVAISISLLTTVGAYAIFEAWLGCVFPRGPFGI